MKFELIPSDGCQPGHLAVIRKDDPDMALQTDFCIGGVRNTVFENRDDVMDYIAWDGAASSVRPEDVTVRPVSEIPGFDMTAPVYLVRRTA